MPDYRKNPLDWQEVKTVDDRQTAIAFRITRADTGDKALYSLEMGRMPQDSSKPGLIRHVPVKYEVKNGQVRVFDIVDVLRDFANQIVEAVTLDAQAYEDTRGEREKARDDKTKTTPRPGLKKLGKLDHKAKVPENGQ
jgi:hypothetical protein